MKISRAAFLVLVSLAGCRARGCDRTNGIAADDASAAPAPALVDACMELVRARCRATDACEPGSSAYWGGIDRCAEQSRPWCRALVSAPGVALTADGLRACADAFTRASCDDRKHEPEACSFRGALPLGAACAFFAQCASSVCGFEPGKACGRCVDAKPKKKGESCRVGLECENRLTCIGGVCAPFKRLGEACDVLDCAANLLCVDGTCRPYAKVGESCERYPDVDCAPSAKCVAGVCVVREPPKPPGERCQDALDCLDFACVRGTCTSPGEEGAACGDFESTPPCATNLVCVGGRCTALDASRCK